MLQTIPAILLDTNSKKCHHTRKFLDHQLERVWIGLDLR
jgi:hypothetical protein